MMRVQEYYIDKTEACSSRLRTFGRHTMCSLDEFLCRAIYLCINEILSILVLPIGLPYFFLAQAIHRFVFVLINVYHFISFNKLTQL